MAMDIQLFRVPFRPFLEHVKIDPGGLEGKGSCSFNSQRTASCNSALGMEGRRSRRNG